MQTVNVNLADRSYTVYIGSGLLGEKHPALSVASGSTALIVSNDKVAPLYLESLKASLAGADIHHLILPDGESFKTLENWAKIIDKLKTASGSGDSGGRAAETAMTTP